MKKKYILIGHKKRHGKDTVAEMLHKHLPNSRILSFAHPMKAIMAEAKGMSIPEYEEVKNTYPKMRLELQKFGSGLMKEYFGQNVWRDLLVKVAEECEEEYIIVSDFRFPNEVIENCMTIKVVRDDIQGSGCESEGHISETALDDFEFDEVVKNNSTLEHLEIRVQELANNILGSGGVNKIEDEMSGILEQMFGDDAKPTEELVKQFAQKMMEALDIADEPKLEVDWDEVRSRLFAPKEDECQCVSCQTERHLSEVSNPEPTIVYIQAFLDSEGNVHIP